MNTLAWTALVCMACLTAPAKGLADTPSRWTVRMGYAYANFDTRSELSLGGVPAPGAAVSVDDQGILMGDVGFDFSDHWTARVALGAPVALPVNAAGTLQGLTPPLTGTLGEIEIAPVAVSLLYAPRPFAAFSPYVGAGAAYTHIMDSRAGDIAALEASSGWGGLLQVGCNFVLSPRLWMFADARKIYFATKASGVVPALGGAPVKADVTLDPLLFNAGIGYRF